MHSELCPNPTKHLGESNPKFGQTEIENQPKRTSQIPGSSLDIGYPALSEAVGSLSEACRKVV